MISLRESSHEVEIQKISNDTENHRQRSCQLSTSRHLHDPILEGLNRMILNGKETSDLFAESTNLSRVADQKSMLSNGRICTEYWRSKSRSALLRATIGKICAESLRLVVIAEGWIVDSDLVGTWIQTRSTPAEQTASFVRCESTSEFSTFKWWNIYCNWELLWWNARIKIIFRQFYISCW